MKDKNLLVLVCAIWLMPLGVFGQTPPPNDNYSNRITLTGSDVTFGGTLAGATIEDSQETSAFVSFFASSPRASIWWTWTAPTDTVLTVQVTPTSDFGLDALAIYSATNGSTSPSGLILPALGIKFIGGSSFAPQTLSVPVSSGSNYQIQLVGNSLASYTFRLMTTNTPVIIQQPHDQTVNSNGSALFYVIYAGFSQSFFTFQWQLNGSNLLGQTAPMLALNDVDASMAGAYTVIVSNSAGTTTSQPAILSRPTFRCF